MRGRGQCWGVLIGDGDGWLVGGVAEWRCGGYWMDVADGWLGCAVVVGGSEAVGGTLCWRHLVLLVEMEDWMFWSGTVGTVEWGHRADCDGDGRWELVMDVL